MKTSEPSSLSFSYFVLRPKYWLPLIGFALTWLIAQLPFRLKNQLARVIASFMLRFGKRRRNIAQINLKLCFPEKSEEAREKLLKENFYLTALGMLETATCWFTSLQQYQQHYTISGQQYLDDAIAEQRGIILLSFHLTSLEIGGSLLAKHYPICAMYKPNKSPLTEKLMCRGRLKHVRQLLKQSDIRATVKALKNNKIVWYATDQNYGSKKSSVFVPFFGTAASTITATTKFAKLSGAMVIPMTQKRSQDGHNISIEIHPPLENFPGENEIEDATRINQYLENYLRENPEDYMWLHQRFRTRPQGEARIYPHKK
ncbi:LpxL/LpxP family Kdo(2)-lipid IV(A) lauroyl/palmitoleoyl acyltransferase [Aliikangiella maris]|uniref:LpxL/LpxP family Kdo(2)-lipid IV(A) lauroyl/palmitoleoyl acyltransferase n=2 Tax=Aliikangiella maris TaxID=3162458 RepID=A0ABV2BUZ9_9GAMM